MPPNARITREDILDAAFRLVRREGESALTVRRIAGELGCSTQPVLYQFQSIREIRQEVYAAADAFQSRFLLAGTGEDPLLSVGMQYIRFAREERNLFRFLFQSNEFDGQDLDALIGNPDLNGILGAVAAGTGTDIPGAKRIFKSLFIAAHGYASLLANNAMPFREEEAAEILENMFIGAVSAGRGENHEETL